MYYGRDVYEYPNQRQIDTSCTCLRSKLPQELVDLVIQHLTDEPDLTCRLTLINYLRYKTIKNAGYTNYHKSLTTMSLARASQSTYVQRNSTDVLYRRRLRLLAPKVGVDLFKGEWFGQEGSQDHRESPRRWLNRLWHHEDNQFLTPAELEARDSIRLGILRSVRSVTVEVQARLAMYDRAFRISPEPTKCYISFTRTVVTHVEGCRRRLIDSACTCGDRVTIYGYGPRANPEVAAPTVEEGPREAKFFFTFPVLDRERIPEVMTNPPGKAELMIELSGSADVEVDWVKMHFLISKESSATIE